MGKMILLGVLFGLIVFAVVFVLLPGQPAMPPDVAERELVAAPAASHEPTAPTLFVSRNQLAYQVSPSKRAVERLLPEIERRFETLAQREQRDPRPREDAPRTPLVVNLRAVLPADARPTP